MKKDRYIALMMLAALAIPSVPTLGVLAEDVRQAATLATSDSSSTEESSLSTSSSSSDTVAGLDSSQTDSPTSSDSQSSSDNSNSTTTPSSDDSQPSSSAEPSTSPSTGTSSSGETLPSSSSEAQPGTGTSTSDSSSVVSKPATPKSPKATNDSTQNQDSALNLAPITAAAPGLSPFAFDGLNTPMPSAIASAAYVTHWTGNDAYTHNLLSHRYGISAQQLDSYLQSTGIAYDSKRLNGAKLLEWEKASGLDVRAIIAIAIAESSLGTQGVAREPGANMFGFGAFDNAPQNASRYSDEKAVVKMTQETIIQNQNTSFAIQDKKAKRLSAGLLNVSAEGGVYFTDPNGSGKRRAEIMEGIDKWIDQHGGTPAIPKELLMQSSASVAAVPVGYNISKINQVIGYTAGTYPWGQCTWYVYNRAKELGYQFDPYMGDGGAWKYKAGFETSNKPKVGYAVSFSPGQAGADPRYGHVAIVEQVKEDGSILISESNCLGLGTISYRTFSAAQASQLTYVQGHK